jgi:hypothetical protein
MSPERSVKDLFGPYKCTYGGEGGIVLLVGEWEVRGR